MRTYTLLAMASNTRQEQSSYAIKAQRCGISLLMNSTEGSTEGSNSAGQCEATYSPVLVAQKLESRVHAACMGVEGSSEPGP